MDFFKNNSIEKIYLAEIARIEFVSTVWKKCRKRDIDETIAKKLIEKFIIDAIRYSYVPDSSSLKTMAGELIGKYWENGLRTLNSLQLASGLMVKNEIQYYFTSDAILKELSEAEGLKTR
ncbi:type II toxin-antitoxin system VapC family toxin [Catalinimonas sp. 4WD22]|uniref:type II toxin-antitoxin system VapC family toxin n=1 Tax=Catalinimonas locisalis TaxID=3133978 RepID=UPI003100DDB3